MTNNVKYVLHAAIWICGEYCEFLPDFEKTIDLMSTITLLPPSTRAVCTHSMFKVYLKWAISKPSTLVSRTEGWILQLEKNNLNSNDLETQHRVSYITHLVIHYNTAIKSMHSSSRSFKLVFAILIKTRRK